MNIKVAAFTVSEKSINTYKFNDLDENPIVSRGGHQFEK